MTERDRLTLARCEAVWRGDWAAVRAIDAALQARDEALIQLAGQLWPGCQVTQEREAWTTASASM